MRLFASILLFITLSTSGYAFNVEEYRFHKMSETSYYGGIHSIAKDSIGRIWFSGYDALFMHNGNSFTRMNDEVESLHPSSYWRYAQTVVDGAGKLYVGTNHGLLQFDYAAQNFERVLTGDVGFVTTDALGDMWLIIEDHIESFEAGRPEAAVQYPLPADADRSRLALVCNREHVWIASGNKLYTLDPDNGEYTLFAAIPGNEKTIRGIEQYEETVYILTQMDGLYEFTAAGHLARHYNFPSEYEKSASAKQLYLDDSGTIWAATQSGIMLLDPATRQTGFLHSDIHDPYSLPNNSVWYIYPDPDGGVWIGTYGGKLAYMTFSDNDVNYSHATPGGLNHSIVSNFEEDAAGNLWIGTEGGGLNYWDRASGRFTYYTLENRTGLNSNMIKRLWFDDGNTLYISAFNGGMERFDRRTGRFVDMGVRHPVTGQQLSIYDFLKWDDNRFFLTDPDDRPMLFDAARRQVETLRIFDRSGAEVRMSAETLFRGADGNLWLVTHNGAYIVDVDTRRIVRHLYILDTSYSVNRLCSYCVASNGEVWFGTKGGGLNRLNSDGSYLHFADRQGESLAGKMIFGILEDTPSGDVWFSTSDGLWCYDRSDDLICRSELDNPDLVGAYYVRACYKTRKGEMVFGGTDGFIMFTPGKIRSNNQKPKVFFTNLLINNAAIVPGSKNAPIPRAIQTMSWSEGSDNEIVLGYRQSNIDIRFSSDSYMQAEKNRYEYRMTGLSDQWYPLPRGQKSVRFFDLAAGTYTFEVRAANNDGIWGDRVSALRFRVCPSPFASVWAYIVYSLLLLAAIYFVWRFMTDKKMFRHRLEMEQLKEQNMRELTQARINFFTNISHDLKTPLTLVVDPLKRLKEQLSENDTQSRAYVNLIEKSVDRIRRMISQLLQFREIESQKITLNPQPGDLVGYIDNIFSLFELYANKKEIETEINSQFESYHTRFDYDVVEKIFTNLISNAIKYTPEKGYVGVKIGWATEEKCAGLAPLPTGADYLTVAVTNIGAEIPDDMKEIIFGRFNRFSTQRSPFEDSTGLGLAIVKELVANLNGKIMLDYDNGLVSFTVVLPFMPVAQDTPAKPTGDQSYVYTISEIDDIIAESTEGAENRIGGTRKVCDIVVIEDDPDMRGYLERYLSQYYNVYTAANGVEGIAKTEKIYPKVVITDLMMPETDGFGVCRSLHSNIKTSHIPVVVLSGTGKDSDNKIRALECGANVFIDKPVDMDFLLRQIQNLIRNQNEMRELYSKKYIAEPSRLTISSMDEELLKKAMEHIERNMENSDYTVEKFVSDMAIGRTLLYQKIGDITGMSIKEFILDIRLKRSAQFLKESDLTISEIAMLTGFNNPKYFSVCFKKHFELTPSEFKRKP